MDPYLLKEQLTEVLKENSETYWHLFKSLVNGKVPLLLRNASDIVVAA